MYISLFWLANQKIEKINFEISENANLWKK